MKIEHPAAFSFIMQEDIFLLNKDKGSPANHPVPPPPDAKTEAVNFNYLGANKKKFLVVVHYPGIEFIAGPHLEALQNILKRLGYHLDDIAILNMANYAEAGFNDLMEYFNPQKLLVLGANATPIGIDNLTLNLPAQLNDCTALFSFSFDEMMGNVDNKKAFWEKMKQF